MSLQNDRLIRALLRQPVDRTPIWIMRQAGRYLPEYRATRAKAGNFLTLCKTPELACEVTLQPLARFDLDAAIVFSDILTIPDAMGLGLYFVEGEGPRFQKIIRSANDIKELNIPDPQTDLRYVCDAVSLCRREINNKVPLIGFSGSPWTLATYMVEGGASKEFKHIKKMLYQAPDLLMQLLLKLTEAVTLYLNAQIAAGAQTVMLFDSWGGILTSEHYEKFSLKLMQQIISNLRREHEGSQIPVIIFTKGGGQWLTKIADSGCDAVGIDWTTDINSAKKLIGHQVALQGNLDPSALYASPESIKNEVAKILANYGHGAGHVFNLGHGISQHIDPDRVKVLVDSVHELSEKYHN